MTDPRALDQRDPHPAPEWREVSSLWARRQALEATEAAVRASREKRKKPVEEAS
jgi:hypothetical protein